MHNEQGKICSTPAGRWIFFFWSCLIVCNISIDLFITATYLAADPLDVPYVNCLYIQDTLNANAISGLLWVVCACVLSLLNAILSIFSCSRYFKDYFVKSGAGHYVTIAAYLFINIATITWSIFGFLLASEASHCKRSYFIIFWSGIKLAIIPTEFLFTLAAKRYPGSLWYFFEFNGSKCLSLVCKSVIVMLAYGLGILSALVVLYHSIKPDNDLVPPVAYTLCLAYLIIGIVFIGCALNKSQSIVSPYGGSNRNKELQMTTKKSKYTLKFTEVITRNSINKWKLLQLLDKYKKEIRDEMNASKRSFGRLVRTAWRGLTNFINAVLKRYSTQIAIAGYYEIVMVFYTLMMDDIILQSEDADYYCTDETIRMIQWILFAVFYGIGFVALLQGLVREFDTGATIRLCPSFITNIIFLYILFIAIETKPFDCYLQNTKIVEICIFGTGLLLMIVDGIIAHKCEGHTLEDDEIRGILNQMKVEIDTFAEHEQASAIIFETELQIIHSSIQKINTKDELMISYYFNIAYFHLSEQFGTYLAISCYYAIAIFILDIIFEPDISSRTQIIVRWVLFAIFAIIALIISIKKSSFENFHLCATITYWMKKHSWSVSLCIGLLIAVEPKPISDYVEEWRLNCIIIIDLILSYLGYLYMPAMLPWICSNNAEGTNTLSNVERASRQSVLYMDPDLQVEMMQRRNLFTGTGNYEGNETNANHSDISIELCVENEDEIEEQWESNKIGVDLEIEAAHDKISIDAENDDQQIETSMHGDGNRVWNIDSDQNEFNDHFNTLTAYYGETEIEHAADGDGTFME